MFSGIVEEVGQLVSRDGERGRLRIAGEQVLRGARRGDSIAVSGCCLTIADFTSGGFVADVMPATLSRTTLGALEAGDAVNLEAAMRHDGRVGGHLVTGHVDGVGTVTVVDADGNATRVTIAVPEEVLPLMVPRGCLAVDGISLTLVDVGVDDVTVSLIPHTREHTTASRWRPGTPVNVEGDLVAKYVQRGLAAQLAGRRPVRA